MTLTRRVCGPVQARLGCNCELILDEFGEKLLEELDYAQEARNIQVSSDSSRLRWSQNPQSETFLLPVFATILTALWAAV